MISINCSSFSYVEGKQILSPISFEIASNECVGVIGANGCGKSTFFQAILGLEPLSKICTVLTSGRKIETPCTAIQAVLQTPLLFEWMSVEENILFAADRWNGNLSQIIEDFNLREILKEKVSSLSGGQVQRVNIARTFVNPPSLLLLDEPFNHLDVHWKKKLSNHLVEYSKKLGITMIMISHDLDAIFTSCSRFIVVDGPSLHVRKDFARPESRTEFVELVHNSLESIAV